MSNEYDISRAFKRIENDLIDSMMRNMKRHQVEEAELGIEWEQWQALQLQELERFRAENAQLFGDDFQEINEKIDDMFWATYRDAQSAEEHRLMDRIKKGDFTPPIDKGSFFTLNEGKLQALLMATKADFARAEYAMLRRANDQYRKIIFDAMTYANATNDYNKAVDMATKDFLRSGINCIVYKNGARHTVPDYARMALRTGNKRAYLMGEGNAHDRYGLHTVRVNKRPHACPKCVGFLGRILIDDVYGGGSRAEATAMGIPTLSDAIGAGFLHPNCKDMYSVYIPEVSKPASPWTVEEIGEITEEYNLEQELKHAQDTVDTYRRMAKYSLDPGNVATYEARADEWQARVDELKRRLESAEIPSITHEGIRETIPVEYGKPTLMGLSKVADGEIVLGRQTEGITDWGTPYTEIEIDLKKQIRIPWEELSKSAKDQISQSVSSLSGKAFTISESDLSTTLIRRPINDLSWDARESINLAEKYGYKYLGDGGINKYNDYWWYALLEKDGKTYIMLDSAEEVKRVNAKTITAIKEREKAVSAQLQAEGVRLKDLTVRQGDDWVNAMQKFHTATEADRPVTLVSRTQYDKIKGEELYRGIAPQSHLRGDISMTKTPMQCAEQLMTGGVGDCFPSRGVYGDCIAYLSNSKRVGFSYASSFGKDPGGVIARMKIHPDARKIRYDDAVKLFNDIADTLGDTEEPYFSRDQRRLTNKVEVGKAMQMLGYDVIYEPKGDGMDVHFYMVLNRKAIVAVKEDWVEVEITKEVLRRGYP